MQQCCYSSLLLPGDLLPPAKIRGDDVVGRRLLVDVEPLRASPAFRRLWVCATLSGVGSQMTSFAVALQIFRRTHSSAAVGAVGLAIAIPSIGFGLFGGAIIDSMDRRRLVLITSTGLALVSGAFAAQAFLGIRHVGPLYCLIVVQSLLSCINGPAGRTFLPRLLTPELVPAGAALNMLSFHASVTVGPAVAGVIAGVGGLKVCYLVDAVSFTAALYGVFRLPAMRPEGGASRPGVAAVVAGLRFIRGSKVLLGALLADLNATVLAMPIALFPAINAEHFGGDAKTLGLFSSALAVGGIVGSALSGPLRHVVRPGRAMLLAGVVWGLALAGFGFSGHSWLTLALIAIAGVADVTAVVFRTSMIQMATPDRYRGRVSATEYVVGAGCPQLGNFRAGAIGSLTSPGISAFSGGIAAAVGSVLIGLALPAFSRYRIEPARKSRPLS
jgi:MFS family permease